MGKYGKIMDGFPCVSQEIPAGNTKTTIPVLARQGEKPAMLLGKNLRSFPDAEKESGIHQACHKQPVSFGNLVLF